MAQSPIPRFQKIRGAGLQELIRELYDLFDQRIAQKCTDTGDGICSPVFHARNIAPLIDQLSLHQQISLASATGCGLLVDTFAPLEANLLNVSFIRCLFFAYMPDLLKQECKKADPAQKYFDDQDKLLAAQIQNDKALIARAGMIPPEDDIEIMQIMNLLKEEQNRTVLKHDPSWQKTSKRRADESPGVVNDQHFAEIVARARQHSVAQASRGPELEESSSDGESDADACFWRSKILAALQDVLPHTKLDASEGKYERWSEALELIMAHIEQPSSPRQQMVFAKMQAKADNLRGPMEVNTKAWKLMLEVAERETAKFNDSWTIEDCKVDTIRMSILTSSRWRLDRDDDTIIGAGPLASIPLDDAVIRSMCADKDSVSKLCCLHGVDSEDAAEQFLNPFPGDLVSITTIPGQRNDSSEFAWRKKLARDILCREMTARWKAMYHEMVHAKESSLETCLDALDHIPRNLLNVEDWSGQPASEGGKRWFELTPVEFVCRRDFGSAAKNCIVCGLRETMGGDKMKQCSRCRTVSYCSVKCQREHWPNHKANCNMLQGLRNR